MHSLIQFKIRASLLIVLALVCFTIAPLVRAVVPPPDGGYPGQNTAEGQQALLSLTTGLWNTALGFQALKSDTSGNSNTATGGRALFSNTTGVQNTANGAFALLANTVGGRNSAFGFNALASNTSGSGNTANGHQALASNTAGGSNTANGVGALANNTSGNSNTANGDEALFSNTIGDQNTATGSEALKNNTDASRNTANGFQALVNNSGLAADNNTATGWRALFENTIGTDNTATGESALLNNTTGSDNTAVGRRALVKNRTGFNNIALGVGAGRNLTFGANNIDIGNGGVAGEGDTIRIGDSSQSATYIAGISGADATGGEPVFVTSNGKLGTVNSPSSARFKDDIKPMDKASEALFALKPVTFRYKKQFDSKAMPQFGLVAEEVEKINPDLVKRDHDGNLQTVRYDAINAMLLNEFLKEHRIVQEQQNEIDVLRAELKEQRALIQKVNDKVELAKPVPQTVLNNQ
jgi:trimeric autotransporter adhesin